MTVDLTSQELITIIDAISPMTVGIGRNYDEWFKMTLGTQREWEELLSLEKKLIETHTRSASYL